MTPYNGVIPFGVHAPFARATLARANQTWITAGRGTGKTTQISAPFMHHFATAMPRSIGGILAQSFEDAKNKILQPMFLGLEMMGLDIDDHYVFGKKPPSDWDRPLTPILDYKNILSFPNGSAADIISLHNMGSANSKSLQWLIGPEAKFFNPAKLRGEVIPILRGHVKHFGDSPWYGAQVYETDKLSPNIHWILEKRKLHDQKLIDAIIFYQVQLNELKIKCLNLSKSQIYSYQPEITKLERLLTRLRKNAIFFGEANAHDNIMNLSPAYIENMRRSLTDYEFRIAILNEDPRKAESGFYPDRSEQHLYCKDDDDDTSKPLGVTLDYQASITPLISFQVSDRVVPGRETLNFLSSIYVLRPLGPRDVIDNFCAANRHRMCKHVYYFYDHTAVGDRAGHKKPYEEVVDYFKDNGWDVSAIYMGGAPRHHDKYLRFKEFLQNPNGEHLPIKMHEQRCSSLILAMDLTGIKETPKGTEKDKSLEKDKTYPQQQATHLPDAWDMATWAVFEQGLYPSAYAMDGMVRFGV